MKMFGSWSVRQARSRQTGLSGRSSKQEGFFDAGKDLPKGSQRESVVFAIA
jgi:hypothetical protein